MKPGVLLTLLTVFGPLSFTTIGGGQGILSEVHRQSVVQQHWMTEQTFVTLFALSRLAPGPGSLLVTLIGWTVDGWAGAIVASIAVFLPSSLLVYGLARLWTRHRGARWQRAIEQGLAPIGAGLMLAASLTLVQASRGGPVAWAVAAASTFALVTTRTSPFLLLAGGALVFLALGVR